MRKGKWDWEVGGVVGGRVYYIRITNASTWSKTKSMTLHGWQAWAKDAEVVRVAECA